MSLSSAGWDDATKTWTIPDMWSPQYLKADGYYYPHPALVCCKGVRASVAPAGHGNAKTSFRIALHNADFFEIGDVKGVGENNTLYVWAPEHRYDLMHIVGSYATYVKQTRDKDTGKDTVAFHIRTRPDPKYGNGMAVPVPAALFCTP